MANASTTPVAAPTRLGWRAPAVILLCGCLISPIIEKPVQRLAPAAAT